MESFRFETALSKPSDRRMRRMYAGSPSGGSLFQNPDKNEINRRRLHIKHHAPYSIDSSRVRSPG